MILCTYTECNETPTLGMENTDIKDDQITASSYYTGSGGLQAWKGRLNNDDYWATASGKPKDPWIQVDLLHSTVVTGVITQGSAHSYQEWVTDLQIQYGDSEDSLMYVLENGQPKVSISHMLLHITVGRILESPITERPPGIDTLVINPDLDRTIYASLYFTELGPYLDPVRRPWRCHSGHFPLKFSCPSYPIITNVLK